MQWQPKYSHGNEFVVDYYNSIQIADTRRFLFIAMYPELYPPL
jgi:hypothetical protein